MPQAFPHLEDGALLKSYGASRLDLSWITTRQGGHHMHTKKPTRKQAQPMVAISLKVDLETEKLRRRLQAQHQCAAPALMALALRALAAHPPERATA